MGNSSNQISKSELIFIIAILVPFILIVVLSNVADAGCTNSPSCSTCSCTNGSKLCASGECSCDSKGKPKCSPGNFCGPKTTCSSGYSSYSGSAPSPNCGTSGGCSCCNGGCGCYKPCTYSKSCSNYNYCSGLALHSVKMKSNCCGTACEQVSDTIVSVCSSRPPNFRYCSGAEYTQRTFNGGGCSNSGCIAVTQSDSLIKDCTVSPDETEYRCSGETKQRKVHKGWGCDSDSGCWNNGYGNWESTQNCNNLDGCYLGNRQVSKSECFGRTDCGYRDYSCKGSGTYNPRSCEFVSLITDNDGDGYDTQCDYDCDDANPLANPGMYEICDTIDNDCDNGVDYDDDSFSKISLSDWDANPLTGRDEYCDQDDDGYARWDRGCEIASGFYSTIRNEILPCVEPGTNSLGEPIDVIKLDCPTPSNPNDYNDANVYNWVVLDDFGAVCVDGRWVSWR